MQEETQKGIKLYRAEGGKAFQMKDQQWPNFLLGHSGPNACGAWWLIGILVTCRPKGREFESSVSRDVGTLGKSFTRSCLWRFGVKLRQSICAVLGSSASE